jgi:hypothetical protein
LLAPNAADQLTAQYSQTLANPQIQPGKLSADLMTFSTILPMLNQQGGGGGTVMLSPAMVPQLQMLLSDTAKWVPSAGINQPQRLHDALVHVAAGTKALGFTTAKEMRALSLEDFLGHLGGATKEYKQAAAVYNVDIDTFLASVSAKAEPGDGDHRTLDVTFSLFGKPYTLPVKVDRQDGHWVTSPDNTSSMGGLGMMAGSMIGAGGMGGGGRPNGPPTGYGTPQGNPYGGMPPGAMPPGAPPPGAQPGAPAAQPGPPSGN